jgi:hypothetical protein
MPGSAASLWFGKAADAPSVEMPALEGAPAAVQTTDDSAAQQHDAPAADAPSVEMSAPEGAPAAAQTTDDSATQQHDAGDDASSGEVLATAKGDALWRIIETNLRRADDKYCHPVIEGKVDEMLKMMKDQCYDAPTFPISFFGDGHGCVPRTGDALNEAAAACGDCKRLRMVYKRFGAPCAGIFCSVHVFAAMVIGAEIQEE